MLGEEQRSDDVFRHYTGGTLDDDSEQGGIRDVRRARRTALPPPRLEPPAARIGSARPPTAAGLLAPPLSAGSRRSCWVELRKIRHDRTELYTRAIQPAAVAADLRRTFHQDPRHRRAGRDSYLDYLAPGILAQSALFIAIFYGIQIIWERGRRACWPS